MIRTQLKSISASAGFLENSPVEFAAELTCIIGARGTCKSTLIESIRFAFETNASRTAALVGEGDGGDQRTPTYGIIKKTLRAGSVRCELSRADLAFTLEREVGGEPRIFVDGVREHADRGLLEEIEIFSQGDLQRIAEDENDELRLALIDRPHKSRVAQLKSKRGQMAEELRELGPKLRTIRAQISTLNHEVSQLDTFKTELETLKKGAPTASPALEAERLRFEARQHVLAVVRSLETERTRLVTQLAEAKPVAQGIAESIANLRANGGADLTNANTPLGDLEAAVRLLLDVTDTFDAVPLPTLIDTINQRFEEESESYYQLRQKEQEVNESLKQQQALKRQVEHLERKVRETNRARAEESQLVELRRKLRDELGRVDDEFYELRVNEIDAINREHGDNVQLNLGSSWNSRAYADRLSELLTGSRIRAQQEVASAIAEQIEPSTLIDLVEKGDAQRLSDLLGRDLGQMTRVVAHLSDHHELYALETELPTSRLEITLFDKGEPKPVKTLSNGQRATALLPIILRPLPYPLLFDQPEDDLDNKFIFKYLISTLRELKSKRQLIFVTHNANIPVLGAADRVIVMHMQNPTRAAQPMVGNVNERKQEILELLEGGARAFAKREEYYHEILLKQSPDGSLGPLTPDEA